MDKIKISGIVVYAHHGVFQSEKELGQTFFVDCEFKMDTSSCNDELEKTVNYGEVSCTIVSFCQESRFDLLETLANKLSIHLLLNYPLMEEVCLTIHKPHAPISTPFTDVTLTVTRGYYTCYLGVGSNLGDRESNLLLVEDEIEKDKNIILLNKSSYIETKPYGILDQPNFMNGVLKIRTVYTPKELLYFCKNTEKKAGRTKTRHWGERTLDVDILFYGDIIYWEDDLKIPHPEISKREFVLKPLVEIEPYLIHPIENMNIQSIFQRLKKEI
ncbi:MAG TPA: 2-amino-4-hydroxy-6-hydroxymethyldihydropteridine diphosphokinase [Epulopiscium sp.]|nr:2-amino-4-hydroxy-6-hydroxymethyldihydropteridine diphosphokinase [Candidatus Epulonipiscium sp.]